MMQPRPTLVLAVTGSRYGRSDTYRALDAFVERFGLPFKMVLGGDKNEGRKSQRGVDLQAGHWFTDRGVPALTTIYAEWDLLGKRAGPARNEHMARCVAQSPQAEKHCVALPDAASRGTWDCVRHMQQRGVQVWLFECGALVAKAT